MVTTLPPFTVALSKAEAEALVPEPGWYIISIRSPHEPAAVLRQGWAGVLHLVFDDIDLNNRDAWGTVWTPEKMGRPLVPFDRSHLGLIDLFVDQAINDHHTQGILINCGAGLSRSQAVRQWLVERGTCRNLEAHGTYEPSLRTALDRQPQAKPNSRVLHVLRQRP